jgi:hypothetical protein
LAASLGSGDFGTLVYISKPGYDETHGWADGRDDGRRDFRLYRPLDISAGAGARVAITGDSSMCGFDFEYRCRQIHIAASANGTLVVQTTSDIAADPLWLVVGSDVVQYPVLTVTSLKIPVTAGAVVTAIVFRPWSPSPSDTGTVTTSLLPN